MLKTLDLFCKYETYSETVYGKYVYTSTEVGKIYNISDRKLNSILKQENFIEKIGNLYKVKIKYCLRNYQVGILNHGRLSQVFWTKKGLSIIDYYMNKNDIEKDTTFDIETINKRKIHRGW